MESLEEMFFSSLHAATPDLPHIREAIYRLWEDVSRYGPSGLPSLPDIRVPGLRDIQIPPPPPPPPPKTMLEASLDWIGTHPWKTSGIVVGVVGAGLLVGYGASKKRHSRVIRVKAAGRERRQVVGTLFSSCLIFPFLIGTQSCLAEIILSACLSLLIWRSKAISSSSAFHLSKRSSLWSACVTVTFVLWYSTRPRCVLLLDPPLLLVDKAY